MDSGLSSLGVGFRVGVKGLVFVRSVSHIAPEHVMLTFNIYGWGLIWGEGVSGL